MPLRSNFEPGTTRWATRRAQWRALGLTDADLVKPKIAIVNSSSQLAICFSHLDEIARRAKRAIEQGGGVAFEVRTAALTPERGWLSIYQRLVGPLPEGAVLIPGERAP